MKEQEKNWPKEKTGYTVKDDIKQHQAPQLYLLNDPSKDTGFLKYSKKIKTKVQVNWG